jgi:hypothetical protein
MSDGSRARRRFTLEEARHLLPAVKHVTAEAVREAEGLARRLRGLTESDPDHATLTSQLQQVVGAWAERITALEADVKGLWLVDFDNGEGYYCWSYPEETVSHYHDYEDGFAGRMKIV